VVDVNLFNYKFLGIQPALNNNIMANELSRQLT